MKTATLLAMATLVGCGHQEPAPCVVGCDRQEPAPCGSPAAPSRVLGFSGPYPGSAAQGSLVQFNDAGFPVTLSPGAAGQSLVSGGPGAGNFWVVGQFDFPFVADELKSSHANC
jgi:hypothetical protein